MFGKIKRYIVLFRDYYLVHIKWKRYSFGKNFHAGRNVVLWAKKGIKIGDNCYIGRNSQIECNVDFGNDILIANNVAFVGRYDHNYQEIGKPIRFSSQIRDDDYAWREISQITVLENDVWIGYGSIILSGVKICQGSIIAAGSVVTKDVGQYSIYGGNPAKKIADRFNSESNLDEHKNIIKNKVDKVL